MSDDEVLEAYVARLERDYEKVKKERDELREMICEVSHSLGGLRTPHEQATIDRLLVYSGAHRGRGDNK